jgi:hypothetical protein
MDVALLCRRALGAIPDAEVVWVSVAELIGRASGVGGLSSHFKPPSGNQGAKLVCIRELHFLAAGTCARSYVSIWLACLSRHSLACAESARPLRTGLRDAIAAVPPTWPVWSAHVSADALTTWVYCHDILTARHRRHGDSWP